MKRTIVCASLAFAAATGVGPAALASEPSCRGLDTAHHQTHGRVDSGHPGAPAERRHHDLREDRECGH